jgi:hypothetical protein
MLNSEQAKLINLGLTIERFNRLHDSNSSEQVKALYLTKIIQYEKEYFDLWFELNREKLEDSYITYLESKNDPKDEIPQSFMISDKFMEYCHEMCFDKFNKN